jgi:aspartate/methionine/tyrosine aminotransferase
MTSVAASSPAAVSHPSLSPRILETLDPCVVLMKDMIGQYAPLWEDRGGIFSLAQGIVYWEPPETCRRALQDALQDETSLLHTYGPAQGIPQFTQALEHKLQEENQLSNHNVMVTVGANQAYVNCVLTLLHDDAKAIVFLPYYFNHVMAIQMTCGDSSVVVGPSSDLGIPNVEWLEATLCDQPEISLVTIVNPGNPTGVSLSRDHLQRVVDLCQQHNVWLVLDCTYEYFTTPSGHQPLATFPDSPHVIHIFSFSKSYSLAGYRCGYLVMHKDQSHAWQNMLKVQDTLPIAPPRISQIAALGALEAGKEWVYQKYETLAPSRDLILDAMSGLTQTVGGSGAMYVMGKLPNDRAGQVMEDVPICRRLVEEWGVAVIPGSFCGVPGWIRVCYANLEPSVCAVAAQRLKVGLQAILRDLS